jgi:hypothetical protein
MFRIIVATVISALFFASSPLQAREFGGVGFPDEVALPNTTKTVRLNGVGYRKKFFIKVYIGALYTEKLARSRDEVLAQDGPNRVVMHFLHEEVSSEKLVSAWNEGFEDNQSDDELEKLRPRIDKFNAMFPTVRQGDVIYLDYIPGTGTSVTINNEKKGVIKGKDFNDALLDIWLGEEPASSSLKDAMLGG